MRNEQLKMSDIPSESVQLAREQFESNPLVRQMRCQQQLALSKGNYMGAMAIGQKLEGIFSKVLVDLMRDAESTVTKVELNTDDFPADKRKEMVEIIVTLFMACDIIETAVMDFNDIIHERDKTLEFDAFNEILELKDKAKAKLKYFSTHSKFMKGMYWADRCDDMYRMLRNKAGSIIRRRGEEKKKEAGK